MDRNEKQMPLQAGDTVVHERFGQGVVDSVAPNGAGRENQLVSVTFSDGQQHNVVGSFLKLESEVHRIDELRNAVGAYGQETLRVHRVIKQFGADLLHALRPFLHREQDLVTGVRPHGDWQPGEDYRDEAYSNFRSGYLTLDPVDFGIGIRVANLNDEGATNIRVVVRLRVERNTVCMQAEDGSELSFPVEGPRDLKLACQAILDAALKRYRTEAS